MGAGHLLREQIAAVVLLLQFHDAGLLLGQRFFQFVFPLLRLDCGVLNGAFRRLDFSGDFLLQALHFRHGALILGVVPVKAPRGLRQLSLGSCQIGLHPLNQAIVEDFRQLTELAFGMGTADLALPGDAVIGLRLGGDQLAGQFGQPRTFDIQATIHCHWHQATFPVIVGQPLLRFFHLSPQPFDLFVEPSGLLTGRVHLQF